MASLKLYAILALLLIAVVAPSCARLYLFDDGINSEAAQESRTVLNIARSSVGLLPDSGQHNNTILQNDIESSVPSHLDASNPVTLPKSWIHVLSPDTFKPQPRKLSENVTQDLDPPPYESRVLLLEDGNLYVTVREKIEKKGNKSSGVLEDEGSDRNSRQINQRLPYYSDNFSNGKKVIRSHSNRRPVASHHGLNFSNRKPEPTPIYRTVSPAANKPYDHRVRQTPHYLSQEAKPKPVYEYDTQGNFAPIKQSSNFSPITQTQSSNYSPITQKQSDNFTPIAQNNWRGSSSPFHYVEPTASSSPSSQSYSPLAVSYDSSHNSKYGSSITSYDPPPSGPQAASSSIHVHEPSEKTSHGTVYSYVKTNPHGHYKWGVRYSGGRR